MSFEPIQSPQHLYFRRIAHIPLSNAILISSPISISKLNKASRLASTASYSTQPIEAPAGAALETMDQNNTTPREPRVITKGGPERAPRAAEVLAEAMSGNPVIWYLMSSLPSDEAREAYVPTYYQTLLHACALNDVRIDEIDDWACVSALMLPGKSADNPWTLLPAGLLKVLWNLGLSGVHKMLFDFVPKAEAIQKKALKPGEKCYYYFNIGTRIVRQSQGLGGELIKSHQKEFASGTTPIWLEAVSPRARELYLRLGFKEIGKGVLGYGKFGADGKPKKDGEGVPFWGMIWRPEFINNDDNTSS